MTEEIEDADEVFVDDYMTEDGHYYVQTVKQPDESWKVYVTWSPDGFGKKPLGLPASKPVTRTVFSYDKDAAIVLGQQGCRDDYFSRGS